MAFTVNEIRRLSVAADFQLVAGKAGLNRVVKHVNLLDFEYDTWEPEAKESDGIFDEKSIIVTSLLFAKDRPDKILRVVQQLYMDGVSAIAIKAVYFKKLPEEVLSFAEEKSLPIFMFDSERNFSENIVVGLTMAIEEYENVDGLEERVSLLVQDNLSITNRIKITEELFAQYKGAIQGIYSLYFSARKMPSTFEYQHLILALRKKKLENMTVLPYQYGILVILHSVTSVDVIRIADMLGIQRKNYDIGVSKEGRKQEEIAYKIRESVYAAAYAKMQGTDICRFQDMGIWQMILPNRENYWMRSYCEEIIDKLKGDGSEGNQELYDTIVCYVDCGCDVLKTAEYMNLHKNTIRYRLGKAKEVLGLEPDDSEFQPMIFLAMCFDKNM